MDLAPIRGGAAPARLLDMVVERSKQVSKGWLADPLQTWRAQVEDVAMDRVTGFKTAASEEAPEEVCVMDPCTWSA